MSQKDLVILIGNRDLQINKKNLDKLGNYKEYFVKNDDDESNNYFIFKKDLDQKEITKKLSQKKELYHYFEFPIVEGFLKYIENEGNGVNHIYFVLTNQKKEPKKDTFYFKDILKEKFESNYNLIFWILDQSPVNNKACKKYFDSKLREYNLKQGYALISSSTPQMRESFVLACVEKNLKFKFYEKRKNNDYVPSLFYTEIIKLIEKNIIKNFLEKYNFDAAYEVVINSIYFDDIKKDLENLKNQYHMKMFPSNFNKMNSVEKLKFLKNRLVDIMEISYLSKDYSKFIVFLNRSLETYGYYLILKRLSEKNEIIEYFWNNEKKTFYPRRIKLLIRIEDFFKKKRIPLNKILYTYFKQKYNNEILKLGKAENDKFEFNSLNLYTMKYLIQFLYNKKTNYDYIFDILFKNFSEDKRLNIRNFLNSTHGYLSFDETLFKEFFGDIDMKKLRQLFECNDENIFINEKEEIKKLIFGDKNKNENKISS